MLNNTNPFVNASVTNSSFDSAPEEAVAIDPEEYWGFTGFAEEGGVEVPVAGRQSGAEGWCLMTSVAEDDLGTSLVRERDLTARRKPETE